jgi:hypothetical protein
MDVTEEKLKRLKRRAKYFVAEMVIHSATVSVVLLSIAVINVGSQQLLEPLYGSTDTMYLRTGLHLAKCAAFWTEIYLYLLFLAECVIHATRNR